MYVILYKGKYFCEYDDNGNPTFTKHQDKAWQFLNETYAKEELDTIGLKKCTIKKI